MLVFGLYRDFWSKLLIRFASGSYIGPTQEEEESAKQGGGGGGGVFYLEYNLVVRGRGASHP